MIEINPDREDQWIAYAALLLLTMLLLWLLGAALPPLPCILAKETEQ